MVWRGYFLSWSVSDRVGTPSTDVYLKFAEFLGCQVSNTMACLAPTA